MLTPETAKALLQALLEDASIPKTLHNAKFDMKVLAQHGIMLRGLRDDTMIAAYLLAEPSIGLKALALDRLGVTMTTIYTLIGTGKNQKSMVEVPASEAGSYAAADADMTLRLAAHYAERFKEEPQLGELYRTLEVPLVEVLCTMERAGVAMDPTALETLSATLEKGIGAAECAI